MARCGPIIAFRDIPEPARGHLRRHEPLGSVHARIRTLKPGQAFAVKPGGTDLETLSRMLRRTYHGTGVIITIRRHYDCLYVGREDLK